MRIERRAMSAKQTRRLGEEIAEAAFAECIDGRVCGEICTIKCGRCGSISCQCMCAPDCPDAPKHLSSDPDKHLLERGIAPLVFEMKRLGMFRPCWSCEGHVNAEGSLWKLPRVWFYCDSVINVRLLAEVVCKLKTTERLSVPWQVVVNFFDPDNPNTVFSLEPVPLTGDKGTLSALQSDAVEIAKSLEPVISKHALRLQRECGAQLADTP